MVPMKQPIKLTVSEPTPGSYVWTLLETDADGASPLVLRKAEDAAESYEVALASGQRALASALRVRTASGAPINH
ncbi:MAG: hypothetical protein JWQ73_1513 [Variovorax sp.]|jgi:hypothetical protein|nr:hypothetical protein [Variovorax sp.]